MKKGIIFIVIFIIAVIVFVFINALLRSRQEYNTRYDFIVSSIEADAKGDLTFYDSLNNKYFFAGYRFNKFNKLRISEGDRIVKDKHSKNMTFSRKVNNSYKVYYVQEPNGMIPFSLYSY